MADGTEAVEAVEVVAVEHDWYDTMGDTLCRACGVAVWGESAKESCAGPRPLTERERESYLRSTPWPSTGQMDRAAAVIAHERRRRVADAKQQGIDLLGDADACKPRDLRPDEIVSLVVWALRGQK